MTNKITVARALVELKRTDDKIQRAASQQFVGITVSGKDVNNRFSNGIEMEGAFKSNWDKLSDLVEYRNKLKAAIYHSNAETKVTVPILGEVSVAQAIEYKSVVSVYKNITDTINQQLAAVNSYYSRQIDRNENEAHKRAGTQIEGNSVTAEQFDAVKKMVDDQYKAVIVDPIGIASLVEERREKEIDFVNDIDYIINESNNTTYIVV